MNLDTDAADEFENMAFELMNKYALSVEANGACHFIICEIEFYLKSDAHSDVYVHCDPDQLTVGRWYFHKKGGTYKGGTFKGLDITFAKGAHGGILIRSMIDGNGDVIEGPCNCVNAILAAGGFNSVAAMAQKITEQPDYTVFTSRVLRLVPSTDRKLPVWSSKRVGLNATRDVSFAEAPYRYITHPHLIKKCRKDVVAGLMENHMLSQTEADKLVKGKH